MSLLLQAECGYKQFCLESVHGRFLSTSVLRVQIVLQMNECVKTSSIVVIFRLRHWYQHIMVRLSQVLLPFDFVLFS